MERILDGHQQYRCFLKFILRSLLLSCGLVILPVSSLAVDISCFITADGTSIVNQDGNVISKKSASKRFKKTLNKNRKKLNQLKSSIRRTKKSKLSKKKKQKKLARLRKRQQALKSSVAAARSVLAGIKKCGKSTPSDLPAGIPSIIGAAQVEVRDTATINVPDDLTIISNGPINVAGVLKADPQIKKADGSGQSIRLEAKGEINISGQILAGNGKAHPVEAFLAAVQEGDDEGIDGYSGGEIEIQSDVDLVMGKDSLLQAGAGSDGTPATALKTEPASAVAALVSEQSSANSLTSTGGHGGTGGNITIRAGGKIKITPNGSRPQLVLGNGGGGGSAKTVVDGSIPSITERTATAGKGGDSGFPSFPANRPEDFEGLTFDLITTTNDLKEGSQVILPAGSQIMYLDEASTAVFGGGIGGSTGDSQVGASDQETNSLLLSMGRIDRVIERTVEVLPAAACPPPRKVDGQPESNEGQNGSNGFFGPGHGGGSYALARRGSGQGKGGNATAKGGNGGNLRSILAINTDILTDKVGIGFRITAITSAGKGGEAIAQAGDGGEVGGIGGDASAAGGAGGSAPLWDNIIDIQLTNAIGGGGGKAEAYGGDGGSGATCCTPPKQGQSGGKGGKAIAKGGLGGSGTVRNYGGSAIAKGGSSGSGGDGNPPGDEGALDETTATQGQLGDGNIDPGPGSLFVKPEEKEEDGKAGKRGSACGSSTPTPTPTSTATPEPTETPSFGCSEGVYNSQVQGCGIGTVAIGQNSSVVFGFGDENAQTADCSGQAPGCTVNGIIILDKPDHECTLECSQNSMEVNCRNEEGGTCKETLTKTN